MGLMEHYLAHITLKSPAIIPRRRSARGYVGVKDSIPGSTLGGAVLSSLRRHNKIDTKEAEELVKSGGIISSPAFPREKNKLYYPSHPFIWKCKQPGCRRYVTTIEKVLNLLETGSELSRDIIPLACDEGHRSPEKQQKPLPASTLLHGGRTDKDMDECRELEFVESVRFVSVPVSRHRASAIVGALYYYEALPTGLEYWAIVSVRESIVSEGSYEIRIGRGVSKGFGKADLKFKKINLERLQNKLTQKSGNLVLYTLSPAVFRDEDKVIDLRSYMGSAGKHSAGLLRIKSVYGVSERVGGWDVMRNSQWRLDNASSPGSLVAAELEEGGEDCAYGLISLGLQGMSLDFGEARLVGLNMMLPAKIVLGDVLAS